MANRNWSNGGKLYMMETMPVLLTCNFIVDSTNGNGLGIRSLKGAGIENVYMHTTATPATGNPNPAVGVIIVQMTDNYNRSLAGFSGEVKALQSPTTATTTSVPNTVTSLGTSTAAQWLAVGFPSQYLTNNGLPNIGAAFIPTSTATIGGSATVALSNAATPGAFSLNGDPNQTIASNQPQTVGAQQVISISNTPPDGTVIALTFLLSNSSVQVAGQ